MASKLVQTPNLVDTSAGVAWWCHQAIRQNPLGRHKPVITCVCAVYRPFKFSCHLKIDKTSVVRRGWPDFNSIRQNNMPISAIWFYCFCLSWTRLSCCGGAVLLPVSDWVTLFSTRLAHAARLGFFYKNALYKFTVIIIFFKMSKTICKPNFDDILIHGWDITGSCLEIQEYWNSTSGFDSDHITVISSYSAKLHRYHAICG